MCTGGKRVTSNYNCQSSKDNVGDENLHKCKQKHPKPKKILLECGDGTGSKTFTSKDDETFQIAYVTIDNTFLEKPQILIKFSSIVKMERFVDGGSVSLRYELIKIEEYKEPEILGSWIFEEINVETNEFEVAEEAFSFIFCDSDTGSKCCDYLVKVTPIEIEGARARVSNGRMAALAQASCNCGKEEYEVESSKAENILLNCGSGNGSIILREEDEIEPPFVIAHVTLDNTCLNKSKALIEFSSIINLDNEVRDVRLQFELIRTCDNGNEVSLGTWTFERTGITNGTELEKAFDFVFCECDASSGCCEYFVKVIPLTIDVLGIDSSIVINNARMVALGQSSKDLFKEKRNARKNQNSCCISQGSKAKKILLECGEGNRSRNFISSNEYPFQLANVTLDTTCLSKPIVNIEFSSLVSFDRVAADGDARLRYELFRICEKKSAVSIGVWVVERVDSESSLGKSTNSFSFTFCDCVNCNGRCEYFVEVTPIEITEGVITATVSNGRIAALAQDGYFSQSSMSNNSYDGSIEFNKFKINQPRRQNLLLECGDGSGSKTFTSSENDAFQLAHVTLDKPLLNISKVLIKFSSILDVERLTDGATVRMQYELFRVGEDMKSKALGNWTFEAVNVDDNAFNTQEESFSFIFCDYKPFKGLCDYFVSVTPIEIEGATATVGNGRMAALASSSSGFIKEAKPCDLNFNLDELQQKLQKTKKSALVCGQGNGSIVFRENSTDPSELDPKATIANISLDTRFLDRAEILIEFSTIIEIEDGAEDIRLQFELFRVCEDTEPLSLGIWNFQRTNVDEFIELTKAFDFIFCECDAPKGCCDYFVTVKPLEIDIDSPGGNIVVNNARMAAFLQSSMRLEDCKNIDRQSDCIKPLINYHPSSKALLECGEGNGMRSFSSENDPAFQLARVRIDTSSLCNPIVNIDFSSIVSFDGSGDVRLRYELFRVCDDRTPISLGIWIAEIVGITFFDRATNTFNFTFCDCTSCCGCCDYFVKVTPIRISSRITSTVGNGRIAALAQETH